MPGLCGRRLQAKLGDLGKRRNNTLSRTLLRNKKEEHSMSSSSSFSTAQPCDCMEGCQERRDNLSHNPPQQQHQIRGRTNIRGRFLMKLSCLFISDGSNYSYNCSGLDTNFKEISITNNHSVESFKSTTL